MFGGCHTRCTLKTTFCRLRRKTNYRHIIAATKGCIFRPYQTLLTFSVAINFVALFIYASLFCVWLYYIIKPVVQWYDQRARIGSCHTKDLNLYLPCLVKHIQLRNKSKIWSHQSIFLFGFLILLLCAYLMKVIPETKFDIYVFISLKGPVRDLLMLFR